MVIRTFYWHDRVISRPQLWLKKLARRNPHHFFVTGNAGDIFAKDLIAKQYGCESINIADEGRRLLLIGSIAHRVLPRDIVCGAGVKSPDLPAPVPGARYLFQAVRGPLSYEALRKAGYDVSGVKFMLDPGLLIRYFVNPDLPPTKNKIGFIPHYRERGAYWRRPPKGISLIDIDNAPIKVAKKIMSCELVYSSSLHGLIFAHALGRPCVFVAPKTEEPLFKYEDYYASIGVPMPSPLDGIESRQLFSKPTSPVEVRYSRETFEFPAPDVLREYGVLV